MKNTIFTGAGVAIVTPFDDNYNVNYEKLKELVEFQISEGTDAIIACGTTGECSTLSTEEHINVVKTCIEVANKRVPVIAGTGSNDTFYAVELSQKCSEIGCDALLMVTPYYNKTSQAGLIKHYNYIADRVDKPIILYNVPSRTGVDILPETYLELSKHERIVAAKEASGNVSALAKSISLCGDNMDFYSGNDDEIAAYVALGAKGVISVLSNVAPKIAHEITTSGINGDMKTCAKLQLEYFQLCTDLFVDVNPIPVKEAMNLMGMNVGKCRLPLVEISDSNREKLSNTLKKYNLI